LRTDADGYPCRVAGRRNIARLQTELDELFEDLWRGPWFTGQRTGFRPRVDLYVTGDPPELTIVVELAGVDPADVSLVVAGDILAVSGHRGLEPGSECTASWYQVEIPRGHFERRVRLPANADAAAARASYSRGLLTIVLPLAPRSTAREPVPIPVQAG
jgi:HSP20 family protein